MGMWQERLSSHDYENGYEYADSLRQQSREATAKMAAAFGVERPLTQEERLAKQLEETRHELRKARSRLEWMENKERTKEDLWQVNSVQRAKYMLRYMSKVYGLTTDQIVSERRFKDIVRARQSLMWEMWKHLTWSLPRIGRFCGNRDHTTVLHARRRVQEAIESGSYTPIEWPWLKDSVQ